MRAFAIAVLAACAAPTPRPPAALPPAAPGGPAAAPPHPFEVSIQVARRTGGTIRAADVLFTNEEFEIKLDLTEAAYVYVGGLDAGRRAYQLIPSADHDALLAAGPHRLPVMPSLWLFLKPPAGPEMLFVIASRRPLSDVDRAVATAVGQLPPGEDSGRTPELASGAAKPTAARPLASPPGASKAPRSNPNWRPNPARIVGLTPRGELRPREIGIRDDGPQVVTASDGFVVYVLPFLHRGGS